MTLSLPYLELDGILIVVVVTMIVGMAIGSAITAAILAPRKNGDRS